jgi:hypothetical protein
MARTESILGKANRAKHRDCSCRVFPDQISPRSIIATIAALRLLQRNCGKRSRWPCPHSIASSRRFLLQDQGALIPSHFAGPDALVQGPIVQ